MKIFLMLLMITALHCMAREDYLYRDPSFDSVKSTCSRELEELFAGIDAFGCHSSITERTELFAYWKQFLEKTSEMTGFLPDVSGKNEWIKQIQDLKPCFSQLIDCSKPDSEKLLQAKKELIILFRIDPAQAVYSAVSASDKVLLKRAIQDMKELGKLPEQTEKLYRMARELYRDFWSMNQRLELLSWINSNRESVRLEMSQYFLRRF